jgi:hypothetical protein
MDRPTLRTTSKSPCLPTFTGRIGDVPLDRRKRIGVKPKENFKEHGSSGQVVEIVLTDDDLRHLEERFGPGVRHMGSWNSDGIFGYCSVPIAAVEKAAESLNDPALTDSLQTLKAVPNRATRFIEILQESGAALIEQTVAAYQERFSDAHCSTGT